MNKLKKIPLILLIISLIWSLSIYMAPATLASQTVIHLDGNANMIDYHQKWIELPIPQGIIYALGDLHCHQNYNRSFVINGNQMPVCSRDVGIFLGCNIGITFVFFVDTKLSPTKAFLNLFLKEGRVEKIKHRRIYVAIIIAISALPVLIDGSVQAFSSYESSNFIRLISGSIFGIMFSFATAVLITSINDN